MENQVLLTHEERLMIAPPKRPSAVVLKIRLSDEGMIPSSVRAIPRKADVPFGFGLKPKPGKMVVERTMNVLAANIMFDLAMGDFMISQVSWEKSKDRKFAIRIDFIPGDSATSKWLGVAGEILGNILMRNMWSCQIFQNPFYRGKEEVKGEYALSVNLCGRTPVVGSDGFDPIMIWKGDEKVPLRAEKHVRYNAEKGLYLEKDRLAS